MLMHSKCGSIDTCRLSFCCYFWRCNKSLGSRTFCVDVQIVFLLLLLDATET
jgi:hypothetical protein